LRQDFFDVLNGAGNDMNPDEFTTRGGRRRLRVCGGLDGANIAANLSQ
jgi:hypothetical protein